MKLSLHLGDNNDMEWAQERCEYDHYRHTRVTTRARPHVYILRHVDTFERLGFVIVGIPHARKCKRWWGYAGLPTKWQVLNLYRIWLNPRVQKGGDLARMGTVPGYIDRHSGEFRPTVATWIIAQVLRRVQRDRVALWPPVYPQQPYHIVLVISYHDPKFHRGKIYRESGATPMYVDLDGCPAPGPAGKFGWCWRLREPNWTFRDIEILRPRNMRLF
jgi:hypothetical protein